MAFDLARVPGIELAVDQRVKQDFSLVAGHFALLLFREPCRPQHGAGARETGHHGADRHFGDFGDLAV